MLTVVLPKRWFRLFSKSENIQLVLPDAKSGANITTFLVITCQYLCVVIG